MYSSIRRCSLLQPSILNRTSIVSKYTLPLLQLPKMYTSTAEPINVDDASMEMKKRNRSSLLQLGLFCGALYAASCYFFNYERKKTSIMRNVLFRFRSNDLLTETLGKDIDLGGWKWVQGTINEMKGIVDVTFKIKGSKGIEADVYLKMQRYPNDRTKWQTTELYITLPDKTYSGYVDEETERLILK